MSQRASFPVPSITCPNHGDQPGRTRCRWCGFDPLKSVNRQALSSLPGALARGDAGLSFPLDVAQDQFQHIGDSLP